MHEQLTGRRFRVDEDAVKRCKDFEEEPTDLVAEVRGSSFLPRASPSTTVDSRVAMHPDSPPLASRLQPDEEWRQQQVHQVFSQFYPDAHCLAKQTPQLVYDTPNKPHEPHELLSPHSLPPAPETFLLDETFLSINSLLGETKNHPNMTRQPGEMPSAGASLGSTDHLAMDDQAGLAMLGTTLPVFLA